MADFRRAGQLDVGDIGIGPDDLAAVIGIEPLDSLTRIARNPPKRVDRVRQHAGQNLHRVVSGARLMRPAVAPLPNDRAYLFWTVELRNAELAKMVRNTIEPACPVFTSHIGQFRVIRAGLIRDHQRLEAAGVWSATVLDGFIVAGDELRRPRLTP